VRIRPLREHLTIAGKTLNTGTAVLNPDLDLRRVDSPNLRHMALEFIRARFSTHFGVSADLSPPVILGAWNRQEQLVGALGLREAAHGFFSQHYLDAPLSSLLTDSTGHLVEPTDIVEVVHLAVQGPSVMHPLLDCLAVYLQASGFRYAACTVTQCLQRAFERRGWAVRKLADAVPQALGTEAVQWGSYYSQRPAVIAGDLLEARRIAELRLTAGVS
jgi:Thermostable hemolysin